jgi:hypothetical protein
MNMSEWEPSSAGDGLTAVEFARRNFSGSNPSIFTYKIIKTLLELFCFLSEINAGSDAAAGQ